MQMSTSHSVVWNLSFLDTRSLPFAMLAYGVQIYATLIGNHDMRYVSTYYIIFICSAITD